MLDGTEQVEKMLEKEREEKIKIAAMSPEERAKVVWNNDCQRCDKDLIFDYGGEGLCDECVIEVKKIKYDRRFV